jgi:hypothetical protein
LAGARAITSSCGTVCGTFFGYRIYRLDIAIIAADAFSAMLSDAVYLRVVLALSRRGSASEEQVKVVASPATNSVAKTWRVGGKRCHSAEQFSEFSECIDETKGPASHLRPANGNALGRTRSLSRFVDGLGERAPGETRLAHDVVFFGNAKRRLTQ